MRREDKGIRVERGGVGSGWTFGALIAVAIAAACLVSGCGLSCAPPPEEGGDGGEERVDEGAMRGGKVKLGLASAPYYARPEALTPFDRGIEAIVARSPARGLTYDTCLARAATEYAAHIRPMPDGSTRKPPRELQEAVLHHAGCPDGWVSSHLFYTSSRQESDYLEHLGKTLKTLDTSAVTHYGAGKAPSSSPYRFTYVLFLAERHVALDPIPRAIARADTLIVRGRLASGLTDPDVLVLEGDGEVLPLDVLEWDNGRFEAKARFGSDGKHWVEILADGELGPRVAALFPVYVGVSPPQVVELERPPDESSITTAGDAERLMFGLVNEDRATFGLPALRWNDEVASIARRHSRDMRDRDFFAHVSPFRGNLKKRFETARFPARNMGENISRNDSVYDAEAGLMQSLGHRENILSPQYTDIGIGIVFAVDAYGNRTMYITQNFATPQRKLTGAEAMDEVLSRLQERRARRGASPLEVDRELQGVAARFARFGDKEDGGYGATELTGRIKRSLVEQGYNYRAFYIQTHTVLDPRDVSLPSALFEDGVGRVGIGAYPDRSSPSGVRWKTLIVLAAI